MPTPTRWAGAAGTCGCCAGWWMRCGSARARRRSRATALQVPSGATPACCTATVASTACLGSARELRTLVNPAGDEEIAMRPDEELLGIVVHSGLVLARSQDVVA